MGITNGGGGGSPITTLFIPSDGFGSTAMGGTPSPSGTATTRISVKNVADAVTSGMGTQWCVPDSWASFSLSAYFTLAAGLNGQIVVDALDVLYPAAGATVDMTTNTTAQEIFAMPAGDFLLRIWTPAIAWACTPNEVRALRIARYGGDINDTVAGSVQFHGVRLDRVGTV